ncbi:MULTISPECIES: serine hydrolase [Caproicibacterium]|uniref:Serine hydrolase n=1 Tax=Caproicibacterium argilliputei TaxID=3030016 RepID=A0AA97D917_9FIRM|nr:serine hydrolase [Caproicibacterium argilliputei]WOC32509.1 serine hydrolase [Caproicibacterium argilliputei]
MKSEELRKQTDTLANAAHARVSFLVQELSQAEPLLARDAQRKLVSASTIKIQILLTVLQQIQSGRFSLQTAVPISSAAILPDSTAFDRPVREATVAELLFWMIAISDNTATNLLIRLAGMDAVNAYCREVLHLTDTVLEREMLDWRAVQQGRNNYTTPRDMLCTFRLLTQQRILTPQLCNYALSLLARQQDKTVAFRYIWEPLQTAHKTGGLDVELDHDTGLLFWKNRTFFFGFFTTDGTSNRENQQLIGRLFRLLVDYLKEEEK